MFELCDLETHRVIREATKAERIRAIDFGIRNPGEGPRVKVDGRLCWIRYTPRFDLTDEEWAE